MGKLFIVSTPIGNLEDITLRAIRVLESVDVVACEDTRKTGILLSKISNCQSPIIKSKVRPKLLSYFEGNEERRVPQIISLLKQGKDVALVSNAGTPLVSDPGFKLVRECIKEGIRVEPIPGPSAVLTALVSSGLPTDKFLFLGYLPKRKRKREKILRSCSSIFRAIEVTVILFESPHRLLQILKEIKMILGDVDMVVCRELTKRYEEITRGKTEKMIKHYSEKSLRGEVTILFRLGKIK